MASTAPIEWAQRKDSVLMTLVLPDVKDSKIELSESTLTFS
jgi:hypothetical protein